MDNAWRMIGDLVSNLTTVSNGIYRTWDCWKL